MFERIIQRFNSVGATGLITLASAVLAAVLLIVFDFLFKGRFVPIDMLIAVLIALIVAPLVTHGFVRLARRLQAAQSRLHDLATRDHVTDALNRRYFFEVAEQEMARAKRYDHPISVLLMDLDDFKAINDRFGHYVGDVMLTHFVQRCRAQLRECDLLGRYGGEEFVALLPETGQESAEAVAERIRSEVENLSMEREEGTAKTTVSIGVATVGANSGDAEQVNLDRLLQAADKAMYLAKDAGRNRVAIGKLGGLAAVGTR